MGWVMMKRIDRRVAAAILALAVAACNVRPEYVTPEQPLPDGFSQPSVEGLPLPSSQWWKQFNSPELNALEEEALANNHDVRAAAHRIAQAEAKAGVEGAALLPLIQATGKGSMLPRSPTGQATSVDGDYSKAYALGISASYEFDLWGKNRSTMEAAIATAQYAVYDRETIAMTLVSDVATTYFQYLEACEQVQAAEHNVANMKRVLTTVKKRFEVGEGTEVEIKQQSTYLASAEATLPILQLFRDQSFNKLALLLGKAPGDLHLVASSLYGLKLPAISPGMPSELLLRRPDIRRAEANLVAANANIGVARAKMFPSITLTGGRSFGSISLLTLMNPQTATWSLLESITQTIFDNGKTQSEIAYYEARHAELVEAYRNSILSALRDVEDALASIRYTEERVRAQLEAVKFAREAHDLSQQSFSIGMIDYLTVLETERSQYTADDAQVQARFGRLNSTVLLFKALGGGMDDPPPTEAKPAQEGSQ